MAELSRRRLEVSMGPLCLPADTGVERVTGGRVPGSRGVVFPRADDTREASSSMSSQHGARLSGTVTNQSQD